MKIIIAIIVIVYATLTALMIPCINTTRETIRTHQAQLDTLQTTDMECQDLTDMEY